jgi:hypothetical protein
MSSDEFELGESLARIEYQLAQLLTLTKGILMSTTQLSQNYQNLLAQVTHPHQWAGCAVSYGDRRTEQWRYCSAAGIASTIGDECDRFGRSNHGQHTGRTDSHCGHRERYGEGGSWAERCEEVSSRFSLR